METEMDKPTVKQKNMKQVHKLTVADLFTHFLRIPRAIPRARPQENFILKQYYFHF